MSVYVFLVDGNEAVALVKCEDDEQAEKVGIAAVFSFGDVSAYKLPTQAIVASADLVARLEVNETVYDLHEWAEAQGQYIPIRVAD